MREQLNIMGAILPILAILAGCGNAWSPSPTLAPNQPNGSSPLASAMVAMDAQLLQTLDAVMADSSHSWEGRRLMSHDFLALAPTDASMLNGHFEAQAPIYHLAIEQFNASPSAKHYNEVVASCTQCHLGTCPGPLDRIAKREIREDGS